MKKEIWEIVKALNKKKLTAIEAHKKLCGLYNVSSSFSCGAETTYDEEHNETYCKECGKCV